MHVLRRIGTVLSVGLTAIAVEAATFYDFNRRATWIQKGMTPAQVRDVMEEGPYIGRLFPQNGTNVLEWSYPTNHKTWTRITFRDGKVVSQERVKALTVGRIAVDLAADPEKRAKLGTIHLAMTADSVDALQITPDLILSQKELGAMKDIMSQAADVAKDLFGLGVTAQMRDLSEFDEVRIFQLSGETFYVAIDDAVVAEMGTTFDPIPEDVEREFLKALAERRPTAASIRQVQPGMKEEDVVLLLGIPKRQRSVRALEGEVTVLTYALSRREGCEIELLDGVVVRITTDVRF